MYIIKVKYRNKAEIHEFGPFSNKERAEKVTLELSKNAEVLSARVSHESS